MYEYGPGHESALVPRGDVATNAMPGATQAGADLSDVISRPQQEIHRQ